MARGEQHACVNTASLVILDVTRQNKLLKNTGWPFCTAPCYAARRLPGCQTTTLDHQCEVQAISSSTIRCASRISLLLHHVIWGRVGF